MKTRSFLPSVLPAWLTIILLSFTFSASAQDKTLDHATAAEDLKTAKATVDAYEQQDWEKLKSFLDPGATIYGLADFDSLNVDETIAYWTKGSQAASPDLTEESWLTVSFTEGPRQGNWVYHWGVNTLTYMNGEKISFPYHLALKIEADKVAQAHFYYNNNKIIRAMGYAISPPLEEEDSIEEGIETVNPGADK